MRKRYQLSLDDLARGVEYFGDRYDALDVFARDLREVGRPFMEPAAGERPGPSEPVIVFERGGGTYKLRFHPSGIARVTRVQRDLEREESPPAPWQPGVMIDSTVLDHLLPAATVGFLLGGLIDLGRGPLRRCYTLHFDPETRAWGPYDGPLIDTIRERRKEVDPEFRAAS